MAATLVLEASVERRVSSSLTMPTNLIGNKMGLMNRLANSNNPYQGDRVRVLAVCSAGLLRSPTAMKILLNMGFNSRAAGTSDDYALVVLDQVLCNWADYIVCMSEEQKEFILEKFGDYVEEYQIFSLNVPDDFGTFDPELEKILTVKLTLLADHFNREAKK